MRKFVFTGGHHNSALSVAQEIKKRGLAEVVWFGHKYTMLGDQSLSAEFQEVTKSQIKFRELKAGKFYKTWHPLHLLRLPWGMLQALVYVWQEKPDLIVSFGGYLAAPVVLAARFLGVPVVTHEQTTTIGLANRLISYLAQRIFVTWPQSKQYLPPEKVTLTGLPLRKSIFQSVHDQPYFNNNLPTLYVTGGKQGSRVINLAVEKALPRLLEKMNVFHQVGGSTQTQDFPRLQAIREQLDPILKERYLVRDYVFEEEIGPVFQEADLVVSRAGAHIVYELAALGKPALFIPIPWVSHNEQYKNARLLVNAGSALILPEEKLTPETLIEEVNKVLGDLYRYQAHAQKLREQIIYDATERIIDEIERLFA